nr:DUF4397 domain-containing protein [uncultured Deefgea sp.]
MPYKAASGLLTVDAGDFPVKVTPTGSTTGVISATLKLAKDTVTTVIAVNNVAKIEALVITESKMAPADGKGRVRVVHAAPAAPAVDVYVTAPNAAIASAAPTLSTCLSKATLMALKLPQATTKFELLLQVAKPLSTTQANWLYQPAPIC